MVIVPGVPTTEPAATSVHVPPVGTVVGFGVTKTGLTVKLGDAVKLSGPVTAVVWPATAAMVNEPPPMVSDWSVVPVTSTWSVPAGLSVTAEPGSVVALANSSVPLLTLVGPP